MTQAEAIHAAETRMFIAVFPNTTNHYDTLFGGQALKLMDEAAFICATRFSRKKVVTVSSDRVDFQVPIPSGTLAEFVATVEKVGHTSVGIRVKVFIEEMHRRHRQQAMTGLFTMVAINDKKEPIPVWDGEPGSN